APAAAKYQPIVHSVPASAEPASPETDQAGRAITPSAAAPPDFGRALIAIATTPLPRNSQKISDSVQPVTTAETPNSPQRSGSRASVIFASLNALRAMIAITAAP